MIGLLQADARAIPLSERSVQCCVTSPPYWGLRDYGVPGQLGLEPTPDAYVANLVAVFREVRRVLKGDGIVWLVIGDSFNNFRVSTNGQAVHGRELRDKFPGRRRVDINLKEKDLIGIPWRVAFALQADGWWLRSDIIWSKPNPMPESVTDRPTKAHEYVFLLTKAARYFYDAASIKEPAIWTRENNPEWQKQRAETNARKGAGNRNAADGWFTGWKPENGRNKRDVWTVPTQSYSGAHFATFPEKLVEPCILAGSKPGDLVLDPFAGSGTVGVVCRRFARRFIGVDLNLAYVKLARARLRDTQLRLAMEQRRSNGLSELSSRA